MAIMKGQVILGHPMPFAPVPWDFNRAPPKRGKSVEELVSEGWEKERYIQMLHFQQQQELLQQSVMCPQDFRPAPGHCEHQAYLGQANGDRQQCWEYEDWDKVPYREVPPQQFFYQSPEAVYQEPRKPQEWTGNHFFYQHQEELDYSDHRDVAQSPRSKECPDYVTRYKSWESDEYCEGREPYSRRDRYAYSFDRDNQDYYDKELDNYRDEDRKDRDYYDHKELDKYDRYDRRDKHYDSKHQQHYDSRKKDRYRYRGARENYQYERYDHREKDQIMTEIGTAMTVVTVRRAARALLTVSHTNYRIQSRTPPPHLGYSDHISVMLIPAYRPLLKLAKPVQKQITVWPDNATSALQDCFQDTDWNMFKEAATYNNHTDLQEYTETVTAYIKYCIDDVTVTKTITTRANRKPWMTAEVRGLLKTRDEAFRSGDKAALKTARANLSRGIKNAKRLYGNKINNQFTNSRDTRSLWQGIQTITDYKPPPQACDDDTSLPDALNHFIHGLKCRTTHLHKNCPHLPATRHSVCLQPT